jgi:hypothetical protein
LDCGGFQLRHQVKLLVNVKFPFAESQETVRLVASVVFGAETPIYIGKDRFVVEIYCSEDTAAYDKFPLNIEDLIGKAEVV